MCLCFLVSDKAAPCDGVCSYPGVPYNGNRMGVPMDKYMTQLHTMTGRVKDAAWSPDGRFVLTASSNGRLQYGLLDVGWIVGSGGCPLT